LVTSGDASPAKSSRARPAVQAGRFRGNGFHGVSTRVVENQRPFRRVDCVSGQ